MWTWIALFVCLIDCSLLKLVLVQGELGIAACKNARQVSIRSLVTYSYGGYSIVYKKHNQARLHLQLGRTAQRMIARMYCWGAI